MTSETIVKRRSLSPYLLGDRKKVQAGITDIQTNTVAHIIIERFLINQKPFERFTYQDVKDSLERKFPTKTFDLSSIRLNLNFLLNDAFAYNMIKETFYPKGSRGKRTEFILTARIKKINNGAE